MPNHASASLIGTLTRDPEQRFLPDGKSVCSFTLAINYKYGQTEEVSFIDVVLFGQVSEIAAKYLAKGSHAFVQGRLKQENWEDKKTGEKRSKLKVVGDQLQMLDRKGEGPSEGHENASRSEPKARPAAPRPVAPVAPSKDPDLDPEEDSEIPFNHEAH